MSGRMYFLAVMAALVVSSGVGVRFVEAGDEGPVEVERPGFLAPGEVAAQGGSGFVCDIENWDGTPDSGFGAGAGELRVFATIPQAFPPECLVGGVTWLGGVIVNATQQGGSTTMPIEGVEITESTMNGPPSNVVIASGSGGTIENVAPFPAFTSKTFPFARPTTREPLATTYSPRVILDGDATPGQFIPLTYTGPVRALLHGRPRPADQRALRQRRPFFPSPGTRLADGGRVRHYR